MFQIIEKNIENGKLVRTIFSLCLLSVMHVFPDLILKQVFSIDFLEALDREVEGVHFFHPAFFSVSVYVGCDLFVTFCFVALLVFCCFVWLN